MRQAIISVLAVICFAACVQEKINNQSQSEAITFGSTFVEYTTRATVTDENNLIGFNVWGYMNNIAAPVFEGSEVEKVSGVWAYEGDDRYWIPGQDYYFAALAPMNSANVSLTLASSDKASKGLGTLTFTNAAGEEDLIYSEYKTKSQPSNNAPVEFEFKHLLSKVRISFENQMANDYINVKVSDIKMSAPKSASIDLASETLAWGTPTAHDQFAFNEIAKVTATQTGSTEELFMIPAPNNYEYYLTFDVTLFMDGVDEILYTAKKTAKITGTALEIGSAYNFSAVITPNIVNEDVVNFEVEHVQDWNNFTQYSQIAVASKLGGVVTLGSDVTISSTIDVVADLTINLNGKTLTYSGADRMFNVISPATLTINGVDAEGNAIPGSAVVSTTTDAVIATANAGASIVINGGDHKTAGGRAYDTTEGSVSISAGRFYNWNPEDFLVGDLIAEPDEEDEEWFLVKEPLREVHVSNPSEFNEALSMKNVNVINVNDDINYKSQFQMENKGNMTINMNNHTFTGDPKWYSGVIVYNTQLTINDGNFNGGFQVAYSGSQLTLNNCNITATSTSVTSAGRYCVYAVAKATVIVNGGKFTIETDKKSRSYFYAGSNATIYITGDCVLGAASTNTAYPPLYEDGGEIIVSGGTYGFDPTTWVADGYEATKNGTTWTVGPKN